MKMKTKTKKYKHWRRKLFMLKHFLQKSQKSELNLAKCNDQSNVDQG